MPSTLSHLPTTPRRTLNLPDQLYMFSLAINKLYLRESSVEMIVRSEKDVEDPCFPFDWRGLVEAIGSYG